MRILLACTVLAVFACQWTTTGQDSISILYHGQQMTVNFVQDGAIVPIVAQNGKYRVTLKAAPFAMRFSGDTEHITFMAFADGVSYAPIEQDERQIVGWPGTTVGPEKNAMYLYDSSRAENYPAEEFLATYQPAEDAEAARQSLLKEFDRLPWLVFEPRMVVNAYPEYADDELQYTVDTIDGKPVGARKIWMLFFLETDLPITEPDHGFRLLHWVRVDVELID
jgi:hypothetical protein